MAKKTKTARKKTTAKKVAKATRGRKVTKAPAKKAAGAKSAAPRGLAKKTSKKKAAKKTASRGSGAKAVATVEQYLADLPEDRREALSAVRRTILDNLDEAYEEGIQYNMIGYYVPHSVYPPGYHCDPKQPLPFASIASQKNHMGLYLFCIYGDENERARFEKSWKAAGKKLDMGKSCVRFKKLEDVPLEVLGETIRRMPAKKFIKTYETNVRR